MAMPHSVNDLPSKLPGFSLLQLFLLTHVRMEIPVATLEEDVGKVLAENDFPDADHTGVSICGQVWS